MKNKSLLFSILGLVFFSILTFSTVQESQYSKRFSQTKLNITIEELKENWGNPDVDFAFKDSDNERVLKYKTFLGIGEYIFKFDKNTQLLILKYDGSI